MSKKHEDDSLTTVERVLKAAAELIIETGQKEVNINALADRSQISRASIHALFGKEEGKSTKIAIFLRIFNTFLANAKSLIIGSLGARNSVSISPIDKLVTVFGATLLAFRKDPVFGKVVLQQLDLSNLDDDPAIREENEAVFEIFGHVDAIIGEARDKGELNEMALRLDNWEIRQILFGVTRSLLRTLYLDDGKPPEKPKFKERDVEIEVLRIVQLYCSDEVRKNFDEVIESKLKEPYS